MKCTNGLAEVLSDINRNRLIESAVIATRDGALINAIPEYKNMNIFAAVTSTIIGAAEAALSEIGKNEPERIIIDTEKGRIIVMGSGSKTLLSAVIKPDVEIEFAFAEIEKIANKIKLI